MAETVIETLNARIAELEQALQQYSLLLGGAALDQGGLLIRQSALQEAAKGELRVHQRGDGHVSVLCIQNTEASKYLDKLSVARKKV